MENENDFAYRIETMHGCMTFAFTRPLEEVIGLEFTWDYLDRCPAGWKADLPWTVTEGADLLNDHWRDLHHVDFHLHPSTGDLWLQAHFYNWNYDGPQFKCVPIASR